MLFPLPNEIEYPTSDGVPIGETDRHRTQILDLIHALSVYFRRRSDVYVSGNLLMLYEEGNPNAHRSPDVLVALGVARRERDNYLIWKEGKAPDFIIEVTSKSTRLEDVGMKKGLYEALGVTEYVIFDPLREYLPAQMKAWRLRNGGYVPVIGEPVHSEALDLDLVIVDHRLRLRIPQTGELLPTTEESELRAESEAARAQREAAARHAAEMALVEERRARAALEAELERLRAKEQ